MAGTDQPRPPTCFERAVYDLLGRVPRGRVTTYGAIARALHASPRAVGQALKRNPFAPRVPCHRVVAADLSLGGFAGARTGAPIARKAALLRAEGVPVRGGRVTDPARRWTP